MECRQLIVQGISNFVGIVHIKRGDLGYIGTGGGSPSAPLVPNGVNGTGTFPTGEVITVVDGLITSVV